MKGRAGSAVGDMRQSSIDFEGILLIHNDGMFALHFYSQKTDPRELLVLPVIGVRV